LLYAHDRKILKDIEINNTTNLYSKYYMTVVKRFLL